MRWRLTIVYSTVESCADQRKHQSSASLAFVRKIYLSPVNSPHKGWVTRKIFPFDDVILRLEFQRNELKCVMNRGYIRNTFTNEQEWTGINKIYVRNSWDTLWMARMLSQHVTNIWEWVGTIKIPWFKQYMYGRAQLSAIFLVSCRKFPCLDIINVVILVTDALCYWKIKTNIRMRFDRFFSWVVSIRVILVLIITLTS